MKPRLAGVRGNSAAAILSDNSPLDHQEGDRVPPASATAAYATFRESTEPVSVWFTEPTVTNSAWSAQKAFTTFMKPPIRVF